MHPLYELLTRFDEARLYYSLARHRPDAVLVTVTFVGERTEIDVFDDGHMEVSRFIGSSDAQVCDSCGSEDILGDAELVWRLIDREAEPTA